MMLSDNEIHSHPGLVIRPWNNAHIQPASVDLTLGREFLSYNTGRYSCLDYVVDPFDLPEDLFQKHYIGPGKHLVLASGAFLLGRTIEYVEMPDNLAGRMEGKSSLGRLGLLVHSTAGFIDPGFKGTITLEMANISPLPIRLTHGMKIAQLSIHKLSSAADRPYGHPGLGSKYQNQTDATASKYDDNVLDAEYLAMATELE